MRVIARNTQSWGTVLTTFPTVGARQVPTDQLVGASEIAERLGARHASLVHDWIARYDDFPQPVARLRAGLVWDWRDVQAWARATGRLPTD